MAISIEGGIAKYFREILLLLEHSTKIIDLSTRNNLQLSLPGGFSLLAREAPPLPPSCWAGRQVLWTMSCHGALQSV